jgi:Reverse transcriptase (RNA-dependent DNA polymerase)
MLIHGFVPSTFGLGIIVPLVKDRNGSVDKVSNYRGINLSPVIYKIFEICLSEKFGHFLSSHGLQFGFKKGSGSSSAIFVIQQVIKYFTKCSSNVNVSSLDATKAFDYVDHAIIIDKLFRRGVPSCLLGIINNCYGKLSAVVRWNHVLSAEFRIFSGVRQGGVPNLALNGLQILLHYC